MLIGVHLRLPWLRMQKSAPDGNITADKIITSTNSSDFHVVRLFNQKPNLIAGKTYTFSCFLKKGGYDFAGLQVYEHSGILLQIFISFEYGFI